MSIDEDNEFFSDILMNALAKVDGFAHWRVTVHETENEDWKGVRLFTFEKKPRHTMNLRRPGRGAVATVKVLSHS